MNRDSEFAEEGNLVLRTITPCDPGRPPETGAEIVARAFSAARTCGSDPATALEDHVQRQ
jgi:hypothetical protein